MNFAVSRVLRRCTHASRVPAILSTLVTLLLFDCACSSRRAPRAISIVPKIGAREKGIASWYGEPYHGRATASGEIYDMHRRDTAAHRRLAFGTWVRVDNLDNGRRTEVRINDRGPFVGGRIIDVTRGAAADLDMLGPGTARVRLTVIAAPPPPSPSPSTRGSARQEWRVQIAALRGESAARQFAGDARARLAPVATGNWRIEVRPSASTGWRVMIAAADSFSESAARALLSDIRMRFPDAFLTRLQPGE